MMVLHDSSDDVVCKRRRRRPRICQGLALLVLSCSSLLAPAESQTLGSKCACNPAAFEITLDFSLNCGDNIIPPNPGILSVDCSIAKFDGSVDGDLVPTVVTTVDILELDANLQISGSASEIGQFTNTTSFTYVSVNSVVGAINATNLPTALEVSAVGENAAGEQLFMIWLLTFTNDCNYYPPFQPGNQIGWTIIVSYASS
jgi:hypothetical protein